MRTSQIRTHTTTTPGSLHGTAWTASSSTTRPRRPNSGVATTFASATCTCARPTGRCLHARAHHGAPSSPHRYVRSTRSYEATRFSTAKGKGANGKGVQADTGSDHRMCREIDLTDKLLVGTDRAPTGFFASLITAPVSESLSATLITAPVSVSLIATLTAPVSESLSAPECA